MITIGVNFMSKLRFRPSKDFNIELRRLAKLDK